MADQISRIKSKGLVFQLKLSRLYLQALMVGLYVLAANICCVQTATCPPSVPASAATTSEQCSFTGYSGTQTYGVAAGQVSNSLYFMYFIYYPRNTAVRKVDASGSQSWLASFGFYSIVKSLSVDAAEQGVYLASQTNPIMVLRLAASDGSIISQHEFTGISGDNTQEIKTWPLADLSGYFVIGYDNYNIAKICKYTFSSSSAQCQTISNIKIGYGHLMISNSQFFVLGPGFTSPNNLQMFKITFLSTSVNWVNKIACGSGCSVSNSESVLSLDKSKLYSFFIFMPSGTWYLYFAGLSVSDGSVTTTRYISSISISNVFSSTSNEEYIVAATFSSTSLVIYSISSSTFTIYSLSSGYLLGCGVEPSSGRFIVGEPIGGNWYTVKFIPQSISLNSDFSSGTFTMTTLATGQDEIIAVVGKTISAADSPFTPNIGTYTNQSTSYVSDSSTTSDVYYQVLVESLSVIELNTAIKTIQLSCSFSGSTSISYSISKYGSSAASSWVAINSTSGILKISAPNVNADTEFYFYVTSLISGVFSPVQKLINLTVINCQAQNCEKCSNSSSSICVTCNSGYTLKSGSCIIASSTSQVLSSTSSSALGASFGIITLMSFINPASIASLWGMINQAQLFFLILLTRASIPIDVQNVITGSKFTLNLASYIFNPSYEFFSLTIGQFDFSLTDNTFNQLSINSDSSLFNFFPIIILIFIMVLLHLLVLILYKLMPIDDSEEWKCNCMFFVKLINKLFIIMTYGWYIRYIFQTNQYILISCIYEIYHFHVSDIKKIASLIFAILVLCLCIVLIVFIFCLSLSSYEVLKDNHNKIGEIFRGIKMQKISKIYVAILLIRRIIFIALLITLVFLQPWIVISILSLLQLCYLILLIAVRPFESKKNNIIEISNEIFFIFLLSSLIHFNSEKDWNSQITQIYMWIMTSNSFVTFLIIMNRTVAPTSNSQITVMRPTTDLSCRSIFENESRIGCNQVDERNKKYLNEESQIIIEEGKIAIEARRFDNNPFNV